jgi:hypothetical protein
MEDLGKKSDEGRRQVGGNQERKVMEGRRQVEGN